MKNLVAKGKANDVVYATWLAIKSSTPGLLGLAQYAGYSLPSSERYTIIAGAKLSASITPFNAYKMDTKRKIVFI